jgi:hypothetical protein
MAADMGIELLTEEQYRDCSNLGIIRYENIELGKTPAAIRKPAAPSFAIAAITMSSCITTVQNLTMPPGGSVAR